MKLTQNYTDLDEVHFKQQNKWAVNHNRLSGNILYSAPSENQTYYSIQSDVLPGFVTM